MKFSLCKSQWEFIPEWFDGFARGEGSGEQVWIPHNVKEMPLHYSDHLAYQMVCGYRRKLEIYPEYAGKRLFLQFDGAAHIATVYVNGKELMVHRCGYTAFRVEITEAVNLGEENLLCVKLDTTENPDVPPFGFVIDYLTYGGVSVNPEDNEPIVLADGVEQAAAEDTAGAMPTEQPSQFPGRYAVVIHLLSIKHNWRLRVRTFPANNDFPVVTSLVNVWNGLDWFEREAFDLFGIVFEGHPDLRRILTDYGFIGHPFRKDFPMIGHVEMIYDPEQKRVVYQPVTIENREITPRVIREEGYGAGRD